MSEGVLIAIITLTASGATGIWAWLRGRRKAEVELEATKQTVFSERFDDASEFARYVNTQIEAAVAPLRKELEEFKEQHHRITDAFRVFFTRLWVWDQRGRIGPMPVADAALLKELRLAHLLEPPFEDTEPARTQD